MDIKSRQVYHAGQTIFREGEPGSVIFLVERGRIEIWRGREGGKVVLGTIPTGGIFGEMAIFDEGPRLANASAVEETVLVRIPAERVRLAMHKADPILGKLIRVMVESARSMARQLEEAYRDRPPPQA